ncbi:MAG: hypothetical protein RSD36_04905 [Terrisporobacter sp.]
MKILKNLKCKDVASEIIMNEFENYARFIKNIAIKLNFDYNS